MKLYKIIIASLLVAANVCAETPSAEQAQKNERDKYIASQTEVILRGRKVDTSALAAAPLTYKQMVVEYGSKALAWITVTVLLAGGGMATSHLLRPIAPTQRDRNTLAAAAAAVAAAGAASAHP